jgi:hypothetical protein
MLSGAVLQLAYLFIGIALGQQCPETPDVDIGAGVPPRPQDIPAGCSDFEILVGMSI